MLGLLRLGLQAGAMRGALGHNGDNQLQDFWGAFYSVPALVTRGLPCALGKLSTTRCAGLTKASSIEAAA